MTTTAHCMKCGREERTVNVTRVTFKNGRAAEVGQCAACKTRTSKLVKKESP